jgi:hypothetical protein
VASQTQVLNTIDELPGLVPTMIVGEDGANVDLVPTKIGDDSDCHSLRDGSVPNLFPTLTYRDTSFLGTPINVRQFISRLDRRDNASQTLLINGNIKGRSVFLDSEEYRSTEQSQLAIGIHCGFKIVRSRLIFL